MISVGDILTAAAADSPSGYTGTWGIAVLDTDNSRRIVNESILDGHPVAWERLVASRLAQFQGHELVMTGPSSDDRLVVGEYLPYAKTGDLFLTSQADPVNQWAYLPKWRGHIATFCHSFDALPGFESFNQLAAAAKVTAFQVGQTIGGHAWERCAFWLTYDAALSDDWKLGIVFDPVEKAVNAVCLECQSPTAARRLALSINQTTFAAKLALGRIHGTNRDASVWEPGELLTIVPASSEEVTVQTAISRLVSSFNSARDYYDSHVAHEVIPHDH